jgi:hypothetical protein
VQLYSWFTVSFEQNRVGQIFPGSFIVTEMVSGKRDTIAFFLKIFFRHYPAMKKALKKQNCKENGISEKR